MMNKILLTLGILLTALVSCDTKETPQVVYDDTKSDTLTIENVLEDTTKVLVTAMPIYLDSTNVLIHPIGWEDIYKAYKNRYKIEGIDSYVDSRMSKGRSEPEPSTYSFGVQSNDVDYISGEMVNLIFEDLATGKQAILTDKILIIQSVKYLKDVFKKTGKDYLFYTARDKDYNRDGKLDDLDMLSYYMSNLDGTNFTKITQDYHSFDTSTWMLKNNRYYFRTLEDVNKDGEFNKKDKYHYYYINLKDGDLTPVEYFPLALMNIQ